MLKDNFCSSPWFHIRINPSGDYLPCRWGVYSSGSDYNIASMTMQEYINSNVMTELRTEFLEGLRPNLCSACHYEEQTGKLNGRQRQLLKSAINLEDFDKSFCSSPHWFAFHYSYYNHGLTLKTPVDLQIDLGNVCNSACIMCWPNYSSRLMEDYRKLNKIQPSLFSVPTKKQNWADDKNLLDKFIKEINSLPNIKYIHFLGGETLFMQSFYEICNSLIKSGRSKDLTIGTTTNCTIESDYLSELLKQFKHVHLGLSIESIHPINEYIRWPAIQSEILVNLKNFLKLRENSNIDISLRITPNVFSIYHLDTIFEFMLSNNVIAESCNILREPASLQIELITEDIRAVCIEKINKVISKYGLVENNSLVINRRNPNFKHKVISDVVFEYKNFLENFQRPNNFEELRKDLVTFIKTFESIRQNSIISYLPEYEKFLRIYGY